MPQPNDTSFSKDIAVPMLCGILVAAFVLFILSGCITPQPEVVEETEDAPVISEEYKELSEKYPGWSVLSREEFIERYGVEALSEVYGE